MLHATGIVSMLRPPAPTPSQSNRNTPAGELHHGQVLADDIVHQAMQDVARQPPDLIRAAHKGGRLVLLQLPPAQGEIHGVQVDRTKPRRHEKRGGPVWSDG